MSSVNLGVASIEDIANIEMTPLSEQGLANSTYAAIAASAQATPEKLAMRYIENGDVWRAERDAGKTDTSATWTYRELLAAIHQTANAFHALGVRANDVVTMVLPNVPQAHFVLWGGETAGIVNPVNPMLEASVIGEITESAGSKLLVIAGDHPESDSLSKLKDIRAHAPSIEKVLVVGSMPADLTDCESFDALVQAQPADALVFERDIAKSDVASLFHTGGTTGIPKLAQHTHGNEVYGAWALNAMLNTELPSCYLVGLPLFHVNAALGTGLSVFMAGGTVLLAGYNGYRSPGIVVNLYELISCYQVTNFSAVPTIYGVLMQLPTEGCDLSSMNFAVCGAAPMPVDLFNGFQQKTGIKLLEGYGLTEATVASTITPPACDNPRIGSIGVPLPYTEVRIAEMDEQQQWQRWCDTDEVGLLLISSPGVIPGYTDSSKNGDLFVTDASGQQWLNSGDLARKDNDGYLWLTGRAKELIIRGGHNIDPKSIEEVLATHPAVNLAAAVGRPDSYAGEIPVAYVDTVADVTEQALLEFCQQHIGERAAIPKAVMILDQLPVTGIGKIHKPTLHLMEIERLSAILLEDINTIVIEAYADAKLGNGVRVVVENNIDAEAVKKALAAYSFNSNVQIKNDQD